MFNISTVKNSVDKIVDLATDTKDLVSLKLELRKLQSERDALHRKIGERYWQLKRATELSELEKLFFANYFNSIGDVEAKLLETENEIEKYQ